LDDAPYGVVYFSMGSILQSTSLPLSKRQAFLAAFSQLKQRVLWKWETDWLPGQPSNVKLGKWLPQSDVLRAFQLQYYKNQNSLCDLKSEYRYFAAPACTVLMF
jgi:hypothetical protein